MDSTGTSITSEGATGYFKKDIKNQIKAEKVSALVASLKTPNKPISSRLINNLTDDDDDASGGGGGGGEDVILGKTIAFWHGRLKEKFKLPDHITAQDFRRLADGKDPMTKEQYIRHVKARTILKKVWKKGKLVLTEVRTKPHRAGIDRTISAPKSISLVAMYDKRVIYAHVRAATKAIEVIEAFTNAKMGGNKPREKTGNAIYAAFLHFESRPSEKSSEVAPSLHMHFFQFNLTWASDGKFRAVETREALRSSRLATAVYRSIIIKEMTDLGYGMRIDKKTGAPEVIGISREYIELHSPRQQEIIEKAKEYGIESTNGIAGGYRREKLSDNAEMLHQFRQKEEKFDYPAKKAFEAAIVKSAQLELKGRIFSNAVSDEGKIEIGDIESRSKSKATSKVVIEAFDKTIQEVRENQKPEKKRKYVSEQSLLADTLNYSIADLTIEEVIEEFNKRYETGKLNEFELDKIGKRQKSLESESVNKEEVKEEISSEIADDALPQVKSKNESDIEQKPSKTTNFFRSAKISYLSPKQLSRISQNKNAQQMPIELLKTDADFTTELQIGKTFQANKSNTPTEKISVSVPDQSSEKLPTVLNKVVAFIQKQNPRSDLGNLPVYSPEVTELIGGDQIYTQKKDQIGNIIENFENSDISPNQSIDSNDHNTSETQPLTNEVSDSLMKPSINKNDFDTEIDIPAQIQIESNNSEIKSSDKLFDDFSAIFEPTDLSKLFTSQGSAEFLTVGEDTKRFQLIVSTDQVELTEFDSIDPKDDEIAARGIIFSKAEVGRYKYKSSYFQTSRTRNDIAENPKEDQKALEYDEQIAGNHIKLWQEKLNVDFLLTDLSCENKEVEEQIIKSNDTAVQKVIGINLGKVIVAEAMIKEAAFQVEEFQKTKYSKKLTVTYFQSEKPITRRTSLAELDRERDLMARVEIHQRNSLLAFDNSIPQPTAADSQNAFDEAKLKFAEFQKPVRNALVSLIDKNADESTEELEKFKNLHRMKVDKFETAVTILNVDGKQLAKIQPIADPEHLWLAQVQAAKRNDLDTFNHLEKIHKENDLTRPDYVQRRFRGIEKLAQMRSISKDKNINDAFKNKDKSKDKNKALKILVNLKLQNGRMNFSNLQIQKSINIPEVSEKAINHSKNGDNHFHENTLTPFSSLQLKKSSKPRDSGKIPITLTGTKVLPASPILVLEKNCDVLVIKELIAEVSKSDLSMTFKDIKDRQINDSNKAKEVYSAVVEANRNANNNLSDNLSDEELEQNIDLFSEEVREINKIAIETGEVEKTKYNFSIIKRDESASDLKAEFDKQLIEASVVAQAGAVFESNNCIENVTKLPDGSLDLKLDLAELARAERAIQIAETISREAVSTPEERLQPIFSIDNIQQIEAFINSTPINISFDDQISDTGNSIMKSYNLNLQEILTSAVSSYREIYQKNDSDTVEFAIDAYGNKYNPDNSSDREIADRNFWKHDREQRDIKLSSSGRSMTQTLAPDDYEEEKTSEQQAREDFFGGRSLK